ncbi:MAG: hypothetical protein AAF484_17980 [Pseudomonadota bacterium]
MSIERTDYARMADQMEDHTLTPDGFSHRAHLGVAFEILRRHDVFDAMAIYARGLRHLTRVAGVPEKFNATITLAFMSLVAQRMAGTDHNGAEEFLSANPDLLDKSVLTDLFPENVLHSDLARTVPLISTMSRTVAVAA